VEETIFNKLITFV